MGKNILLINELAGYGKVALSAMIPVLSHMEHHLYNLPTALVSNTLDYGKFDILETTDYMRNTIAVWEELSFHFDAISTGFIVSQEQAELIASYCREQHRKNVKIFTDPIMGDEGNLYNGVTEATVSHMRELVAVADCIVLNYTEAVYLADVPYRKDGVSREEGARLIRRLRDIGARSVVITSAQVEGADAVIGYDADSDRDFMIPFSYVPVRFPGTGDIFSAVLTGKVLDGCSLQESTAQAMTIVRELIIRNKENADKFKGIPIESCLEVIR